MTRRWQDRWHMGSLAALLTLAACASGGEPQGAEATDSPLSGGQPQSADEDPPGATETNFFRPACRDDAFCGEGRRCDLPDAGAPDAAAPDAAAPVFGHCVPE